jgi:archaellum biogenesis ATPase FlaH
MIPKLLSDALGVSFDSNIGHDFLEDSADRHEFYNNVEEKIPFNLDYLNEITKGGLPKKSLNIILAGCVHPDTPVKIRYKKESWVEKEVPILMVRNLMLTDHEVEVWSPDGWVYVEEFVDKGMWEEYILHSENGKMVRCNENHLFKTTMGWMSAKEIFDLEEAYGDKIHVMTEDGFHKCEVKKTNYMIPIVDISVASEQHRYYTNGVESHNTGVGKSLFMCHMAAANLMDNKNVLYITMEMAEERIAERIDANLLNIKLDDLADTPKDSYNKMIEKLKSKTLGKLIIKEYPTSSAHAGHFRHLLNELKQKKNFVPDIIYIDYLNICLSSRIKNGSGVNSYTYIKSIAEELRGLAVEFKVPIVSATQTTRSGYADSDVSITDTSESFGLPATADLMFAVISSEEMEKLNQLVVKQLKNRYNDPNRRKRFVIGVDRSRMKLYDVEDSAQTLMDDTPTFDRTPSGTRMNDDFHEKMKGFK